VLRLAGLAGAAGTTAATGTAAAAGTTGGTRSSAAATGGAVNPPVAADAGWPVLPAEVTAMLRKECPASVAEILTVIQGEVAEYTRPLDPAYVRTLRRAVEHAVRTFIERVAAPPARAAAPATPAAPTTSAPTAPAAPGSPDTRMAAILAEFRAIGAAEAAEGRSLEPLQSALRLGARVGWRRLCAVAARQRLDMLALGRVGEAIFVYLDELAAASAQGYLDARAEFAGERERRRRRLLDLILADPPAPADAVAEAARAAGWTLPDRIAVVALGDRRAGVGPQQAIAGPQQATTGPQQATTGPQPSRPPALPALSALPALPGDVLADWSRREPCLLIPDPDRHGRIPAVDRALAGWAAAMGPVEPLERAAASLHWARRTLDLAERGIIDGRGLVRADEHLAALLIFADEELTGTLRAARLAPLQRLRPAQQDRLAETLLIWLQHGCNANEVALQVRVHPQTVRYRLRQADDLFGDQLRDPDQRFELEIALRARQLLGRAH
jgi:PucR C-terminal helix-turn-helix domain